MFEATLEQMIIDLGVGADVLQTPYKQYGFLTPHTWMSHLWEFLEDSHLVFKHNLYTPFCRQHDQVIIPVVANFFTQYQPMTTNFLKYQPFLFSIFVE